MNGFSVVPVPGMPMVEAGDDLTAQILQALASNGVDLVDGDVVCVAQKVISKAEGQLVPLADVTPSAEAIALVRRADRSVGVVSHGWLTPGNVCADAANPSVCPFSSPLHAATHPKSSDPPLSRLTCPCPRSLIQLENASPCSAQPSKSSSISRLFSLCVFGVEPTALAAASSS